MLKQVPVAAAYYALRHAPVHLFDMFNNPESDFSFYRKLKIKKRIHLLKKKPSRRAHINTTKLKGIINYLEFKCGLNSSVGQNRPIWGSDIDGGLVVTRSKTTLKQEIAFINELKHQGFKITSIYDLHKIKRALKNNLKTNNVIGYRNILKKEISIRQKLIRFMTKKVLEKFVVNNNFFDQGIKLVYLTGKKIE